MKSLGFGLSLLLVGAFVFAQSEDVKFTGCLTNGGSIVKVAIGDVPQSPCIGSQLQISWNAQGPKGDKGDQGNDGPAGPPGANGAPGANGTNGINGTNGTDGKDGKDGKDGAAAPRYEFVGFSEVSGLAWEGIARFNAWCDIYDASARMCTSEEFMNTPYHIPSGVWGRIRPVFKPCAGGSDREIMLLDASGETNFSGSSYLQGQLTCNGWSRALHDEWSLMVDSNGKFFLDRCDVEHVVACCAPVEEDGQQP
jgi:hypothetical protein